MKTFPRVLGKLALIVVGLLLVGTLFVYSGFYDVAATTRHTKPVEQILRVVMMRSVVAHARSIRAPANFDPQNRALAERAAGHYELMCRTCHGAPGKKPEPWQLYPAASDLADALRTMRWSDAEVFWIIKNGIKDTGMSAFGGSHDDEELWALTAFVRQMETTTPDQYRSATERTSMKGGAGHEGRVRTSEPALKSEPGHKH